MSAKTVADLRSMGFTEEQCTKAVQTVGDNLEAACNWIVTHGQSLVENVASADDVIESASMGSTSKSAETTVATSFKCGNCGKLSATMQMAIVHAERTGHDQIEESEESITPLTVEEKAEKKAKLLLRIQEKKKENAVAEQREAVEAEKKRRANLQAAADLKREAEEREMKEIVEERKRSKAAERVAKQRVLDQINADKEKRRQEREGVKPAEPCKPTEKAPTPPPVDHKKARLQIRQVQTLGKVKPLVHEFSGEEPLAAVRLFIQINRCDGFTKEDGFHLKTAYPPQTFTEADMEAPLKSLGLTPSGTLIMEPLAGAPATITIN